MQEKITFGGQAVIEGVMMRSPDKYAISVRKKDNKISTKILEIKKNNSKFQNLPFIRGTFKLAETLTIGMQALLYSANESGEEKEKLTKKELALTIALGIGMTIFMFYFLPLVFARVFAARTSNFTFNMIDGLARLAIFIIYLLAISLMEDIKRLFQYHGAEHKVVNCFEAGEKLTLENVKKYSVIHPRCGTTFLIIVFSISILIFTIIPKQAFLMRFALRILLLPVIAGISYEVLRWSAKNIKNPVVMTVIKPGLLFQRLTTREPDDSQIEVGIKALKSVL